MTDKEKAIQLIDKLDLFYAQESKRNPRFGYRIIGQIGSQHIEWAKSAMDKFVAAFDKTTLKVVKQESLIQTQREELERQKNRIAQLEKEYGELSNRHTKLKAEYQKFAKNKGQGRPQILTSEIKQWIMQNTQHGHSATKIHEALIQQGIQVSYEAVRKYISHGKTTGNWS